MLFPGAFYFGMSKTGKSIKKLFSFIFPDRKVLILFLFSLFTLLSLFSVGFYLNDEMEQGTCFYNLLKGHLTIEEIPEYYYVASSGLHVAPRFTEYGGHRYIAASHGVAVFSLPFYYFLLLMDFIVGVEIFFIILWSFLLATLIFLLADMLFVSHKKRKMVRIFGIAISAAFLIFNLCFIQHLGFNRWGPVLSIQFMSIFFTSLGIIVLFRFFRYCFNEKVALFGSFLLIVSSPVTFWGIGQKYHALNLSLLIFSFATFFYGKMKKKEKYHLISYVFAGLAVWVQLFSGIVIFLTLLLIDFLSIKKKRVSNYSKILIVSILSLTPYFVENYVIYNNPLYPGYIAKGNKNVIPPSPPTIEVISPVSGEYISGLLKIWYKVSENAEASVVSFIRENNSFIINETKEKEVVFLWNTTNFEDGIGIISIKAWNWRGDISYENITIFIDNNPPIVKIQSPQQNSLIAKKCEIISTVSEDVAYVIYEYSADGKNWYYIGNDTTPYNGFFWNVSSLEGIYLIRAIAYDKVGFNNTDMIKVAIDNTRRKPVIVMPQDGDTIGGNYNLSLFPPSNVTHVVYEYYFSGGWKRIGVDESPYTPFIWNTSQHSYIKTAIRVIAYSGKDIIGIDVKENITIDNRKPFIKISSPTKGEKLEDFAIIEYNISNNSAFVEILYSTDNKTWYSAGYTLSRKFLLSGVEGKIFAKVIAFTKAGVSSYDETYFVIMERKKITLLSKIRFIMHSIHIGINFFKDLSAIGHLHEVPWKLYKSFFSAEGTDSSFAFFTFVPFLILSLFSPVAYIKKRKIKLIEWLMVTYIIIHLFFFIDVSTQQGGGYDVRFYLPLHVPFLFFSLIMVDYFGIEIKKAAIAYFFSFVFILPALIWSAILTNHIGCYYLIKLTRPFAKAVLYVLFILAISLIFNRDKKREEYLKELITTFIGASLFVGTWILILTMIVYSRGVYYLFTESNEDFSMIIPFIKILQDFLQNLLR